MSDESNNQVCVLNNAKCQHLAGSAAAGTRLSFWPGATNVPRKLFQQVHDASDSSGAHLRALLAAGTLTIVDVHPPLDPSTISKAQAADLTRAASRFGDPETRARLAQRFWILQGQTEMPSGCSHLFAGIMGEPDESPSDLQVGWKCFVRYQRARDAVLTGIAKDQAAVRANQARLATVAAGIAAAAQKGGK